MLKHKTTKALAVISVAVALTGCSQTSNAQEQKTKQPELQAPTLSVPKTSGEDQITVRVNGGPLKSGTKVHIGAYGGTFNTENIECMQEVGGQDVVINGSGKSQTMSVSIPHSGVYQMVLSAPGYASECGNPDARTRALQTPTVWLDGDVSTDGAEVTEATAGKPFDMSIIFSDGLPDIRPLPVNLKVHGPYENQPELRAAGCKKANMVSTTKVQWDGQKKDGQNPYQTTELTIDDPGLYLVTAKVQKTEQSNPASTECSNYQSVARVAVSDG